MKKLTVKMLFPQKKSLMVSIPLANINKAPPSQAKTLAMLKANLGQQKMERSMKGPIGAYKTSDTVLPSSVPLSVLSFPPLRYLTGSCHLPL